MNAFCQTLMNTEDVLETEVKTLWGLFEWFVMPIWCANAPARQCKRIKHVLGDLINQCYFSCVDDVVIYSQTVEEHEKHLMVMMEWL